MEVYIQTTENPQIIKFVAQETLIPGALEAERNSLVPNIPIIQKLFGFSFIEKIFITANFVAVSKSDETLWENKANEIKELISKELTKNPKIYPEKKEKTFPLFADMTPNPNVMKFVSTENLIEGFLEVEEQDILKVIKIPLAKTIFKKFKFVKKVFISDNFISVTKDNTVEWHDIMISVKDEISEFLHSGQKISNIPPSSHDKPVESLIKRNYNKDEQKISEVIEEFVAPKIGRDGGKISLVEYDEVHKTAKMLLQGSCSGCPSSIITLKNGIENILKHHLPGMVEKVEAIND